MVKLHEDLLQPNALHSPASTLPSDILSLIFQQVCTIPDLNGRHSLPTFPRRPTSLSPREKRTQFTLSAVSVYWRRVATLLTPYLWTSVDLFIGPSTVNKTSAILQAFLTYSGQLSLAIAVEFDNAWAYDTNVLVDPSSDAVLRQHHHRIRELYLFGLPDTWIPFLPSLSNLVHLSIRHLFDQDIRSVTIKSQCSKLTLRPCPGGPQLSCPNLTVLHLQGAYIDFCLEMLMTYPNLIEFRTRNPEDNEEEEREETLLTDPLVLPNMEVFEWSVNTTYMTDISLLRHLRMPVLKELVWVEEDHDDFETMDATDVFFRDLPSTLVHLHIHNPTVQSDRYSLASVFDQVYGSLNIECLTLSGVDGAFLSHVFQRLTPALESSSTQPRVKLPKLKAILIKNISAPRNFDQDKVLQMLERRFLVMDSPNQKLFRLEFPSEVVFSLQFQEKLKEMIGCGLKVDILEGMKPVDWL